VLSYAELHWLYRETGTALDGYLENVQRGDKLGEALAFCCYLRWSGIIRLLKQESRSGTLPVDGALIDTKCGAIADVVKRRDVAGLKSGSEIGLTLSLPRLDAIERKLDIIASELAKRDLRNL
jgi:hypothetical protein